MTAGTSSSARPHDSTNATSSDDCVGMHRLSEADRVERETACFMCPLFLFIVLNRKWGTS
jgi:hypothetical protein